jgi:hypothetical protein
MVERKMERSCHACRLTSAGRGARKRTARPAPRERRSGTSLAPAGGALGSGSGIGVWEARRGGAWRRAAGDRRCREGSEVEARGRGRGAGRESWRRRRRFGAGRSSGGRWETAIRRRSIGAGGGRTAGGVVQEAGGVFRVIMLLF